MFNAEAARQRLRCWHRRESQQLALLSVQRRSRYAAHFGSTICRASQPSLQSLIQCWIISMAAGPSHSSGVVCAYARS